MASLVIPGRFCGPPGIANGGYVAGTLSTFVASPAVTVRLRRPAPLDRMLDVRSGAVVELLDGDELLANAEPAELNLQIPDPPSAEEAAAAVAALPSWEADHRFPHCWG